MEEISINALYDEMKQMHRELHELRVVLVQEVKPSKGDKQALAEAMKEYRAGKTVSFKSLKKG